MNTRHPVKNQFPCLSVCAQKDAIGKPAKPANLLRRLRRDTAANVLVITAAAVIPMIALTGSAIDISRIYLAKNRLQAACDSGVLAGRKAMTTLTYTTAAQNRANAMFNFNFDQSDYRSTDTDFDAVADAEGKLTGEASTTLPMIVMDMMGFDDRDIEVECSADIQVPNIDIVFVLDVTGSMDESIDNTKKITALKAATIGFYDSIATAMAGNTRTRVRYGFVPYSQMVNGSELFVTSPDFEGLGQVNRSHLIDIMTVQSRVANFSTEVTGTGYTPWQQDAATPPTSFDQRFATGTSSSQTASRQPDIAATPTGTKMSNLDCDDYSANLSMSIDVSPVVQMWFPSRTSWPGDRGIGNSVLYRASASSAWQAAEPTTGTSYTRATFSRVSAGWQDNNGAQTGSYLACTRRVTHTRFVRSVAPPTYRFTNWSYQPVNYNVTSYAGGVNLSYVSAIDSSTARVPTAGQYNLVQLAALSNQTGFTTSSTSWNGCLEERTTTAASSFSPIPSAAKDLDYISGGTTGTMRWRPALRELTYLRPGTANVPKNDQSAINDPVKPGNACPSASMRNLREYDDRSTFTSYVNSLQPSGNTYLDVGMVWGLRLIAPQGMFAQRNLTGPNGGQISRHIIFLTDGAPVSSPESYTAYGAEQTERRITGNTGVAAATLHARRFQALCDAERGRVGIWAVAFGTSVTGNLTNCADSGRAMQANNTTELRNAFSRIANEVADLRLVQ